VDRAFISLSLRRLLSILVNLGLHAVATTPKKDMDGLAIATAAKVDAEERISTAVTRTALVRGVPSSFCDALSMEMPSSPVDLERARAQHAAYVKVLQGLVDKVIELPADDKFPDCPFIEDTAVVIGNRAFITHPGASSRQGEEVAVREALKKLGIHTSEVESPGSIDGGDVLYASGMLFVGKSTRTNEAGINALAKAFPDIQVHTIPVLDTLHLKSVLTQIAPQTLAVEDNEVAAAMLVEVQRKGGNLFKAVQIAGAGAANTILVGDTLVCSATLGSNLEAQYSQYAKNIISVDISEFHKVDGGLTCLSIIIEH